MLKFIEVENFKSFRKEKIKLANLTIFAGANGAGKSTLLQLILLLKQADYTESSSTLHLNGSFVNLGNTKNLLYKWAKKENLEFSLFFDEDITCTTAHFLQPGEELETLQSSIPPQYGRNLDGRLRYLSASRIVPADSFQYSTDKNAKRDLGINGEYAVAYLAKNGSSPIEILALDHPESGKYGIQGSLEANVNAWLQKISEGVQVTASRVTGTSMSLLNFEYNADDPVTDLSPYNVGFGLTYLLPVILLILSASPGDILIIENPESHVHPAGQIAIGVLLAKAAYSGIQILIETHSDHLFNGVRLYIKQNQAPLKGSAFYFAERKANARGQFHTKLSEVKLYPNAKIKSAPVGFFDAWEAAIFKLI